MSTYTGRFPYHLIDSAVDYHRMRDQIAALDAGPTETMTKVAPEEVLEGNRAQRRTDLARRRKAALRAGAAAINTRGQ